MVSCRMYIKFIRKIKRTEDIVHKSIQESGLPREEEPQRRSDSIPEHLKSLSSLIDDCDENNGATCTVKDDSDGNEAKRSPLRYRKGKKKQSHNVQNSADVDEMKLIGLKLAMFNYRSCGKESLENGELGNQGRARYEIVQTNPVRVKQLSLTNDEIEKFISTWKGACQKHTVEEVMRTFKPMLLYAILFHIHMLKFIYK